MKVKSESEVAQSCPTLATPWTAAYQAPPSMGFSRQKYWSGVPYLYHKSNLILAPRLIQEISELLQWIQSHQSMANSWGKVETVTDFVFLGSKITADGDCGHEIKRRLLLGRKAMTNLQHIQKQKHHFADKGLYSQSHSFSNSHVQMWELGHKEGWALKNWHFWIVLLEKTLDSPLDSKVMIKPVNPKGNQP